MPTLELKPTHKAVSAYYDSLAKFAKLGIKHETAVRSAFQELLEHCARQFDWKLVPEYAIKRKGQADAKADGALLDNYGLNHGLWEAKDSADDLEKEIKHKFAVGYPKQNILFWQPDRAVLYQNGERFYEADLTKPDNLVHILDALSGIRAARHRGMGKSRRGIQGPRSADRRRASRRSSKRNARPTKNSSPRSMISAPSAAARSIPTSPSRPSRR